MCTPHRLRMRLVLLVTQVLACGAIRSSLVQPWQPVSFDDLGITLNETTSVTLRLQTCERAEIPFYTKSASYSVKIDGRKQSVTVCNTKCNGLKLDPCEMPGIVTISWADMKFAVSVNCDETTTQFSPERMTSPPSKVKINILTRSTEGVKVEYGDDICLPPTTTSMPTTTPIATTTTATAETTYQETSYVPPDSTVPPNSTVPPSAVPELATKGSSGLDSGSRGLPGLSTICIAGALLQLGVAIMLW